MPRMTTNRKLTGCAPRIALIGCGRWGQHILRDLKLLGCEVVVLVNSNESALRAEAGQADQVVDDLSAVGDVDGYVVAVPTALHDQIIFQLLDTGKPIFCEKPMTHNVASAEKIADAGQGQVFVMDKWRYHPGIERLAGYASSREFGRLVGIDSIRQGWGNPHVDVNPAWILAPHDLSIFLEIGGAIPPLVSCVADKFEQTLLGLRAQFAGDFWATLNLGVRSAVHNRAVMVHFERAVVALPEGVTDHLVLVQNPAEITNAGNPKVEKVPIDKEFPLIRELRAFVDFVQGGPPIRTGVLEALQIVRSIDEMLRVSGMSQEGV